MTNPLFDIKKNNPIQNQIIVAKPNAIDAEKTFWKLGDRFWMQIMDGKYHEFGPSHLKLIHLQFHQNFLKSSI